MSRRRLLAVAVLLVAACGEPSASVAQQAADRLCAQAAEAEAGQVVGAFPTTVQEAREHAADPHGAAGDPSVPVPGTLAAGWDAKPGEQLAAVCYLDAAVAKGPPPAGDGTVQPSFDRIMLITTERSEPVLWVAGYRTDLSPAPLPRRR